MDICRQKDHKPWSRPSFCGLSLVLPAFKVHRLVATVVSTINYYFTHFTEAHESCQWCHSATVTVMTAMIPPMKTQVTGRRRQLSLTLLSGCSAAAVTDAAEIWAWNCRLKISVLETLNNEFYVFEWFSSSLKFLHGPALVLLNFVKLS